MNGGLNFSSIGKSEKPIFSNMYFLLALLFKYRNMPLKESDWTANEFKSVDYIQGNNGNINWQALLHSGKV